MQITSSIMLVAAAALQLASPVSAGYENGKAQQINFYNNGGCSAYRSETATWWTRSPHSGRNWSSEGDCFALNMPGASKSVNVANAWDDRGYASAATCFFYDGYDCKGVQASSTFQAGNGNCLNSRSSAGYLWKSARCIQ
ncbi:hypothetical protein CPLU01_13054 [Colletotrichum plurivorum]|uniref:Secreted protein n=1 Tax=Colletotrichum plurivorum TaxID=2175906 RepID=A0A8H6JVC8_9PEZI|nr:hypothetical protein CPLU01_13054 [Colletotrichum plurivorum]